MSLLKALLVRTFEKAEKRQASKMNKIRSTAGSAVKTIMNNGLQLRRRNRLQNVKMVTNVRVRAIIIYATKAKKNKNISGNDITTPF